MRKKAKAKAKTKTGSPFDIAMAAIEDCRARLRIWRPEKFDFSTKWLFGQSLRMVARGAPGVARVLVD